MEEIRKLQEMIDKSSNIVFFGGAGVSTESNIPDFRSEDGLYHLKYDVPPETIISHTFFLRHPEEFYRFYKERMLCLDAEPNPAHRKLAKLEAAGKLTAVVTQNIDGLHQKAGSKTVYELHGSIRRNYCMRCGKFYDAEYIRDSEGIPSCGCGGGIKPDVVQTCALPISDHRRHLTCRLPGRRVHRLFPWKVSGTHQQGGNRTQRAGRSCDTGADRTGDGTNHLQSRGKFAKIMKLACCYQVRKQFI